MYTAPHEKKMYSKTQIAKIYSPKCMFPYYLKLMLARTNSQSYILSTLLQKNKNKAKSKQEREKKRRKEKEKERRGEGGKGGQ